MKILQLTAHFSPNVGGVETHLDDLVCSLVKRNHDVFVLTYRPLTTKAPWKLFEKKHLLQILRIPWFPGFFYVFVHNPILEFLYLLPGLFLATPIVLLSGNVDIIHTHGLVAGFVGIIWGKIFRKRTLVTLHSIYHFPSSGLYHRFVRWIFLNADAVLCISQQSALEVISLGIAKEKVHIFTYWIDLEKFRKVSDAKNALHLQQTFTVLFVGRLVVEKGINELLAAAELLPKEICLLFAGTGPLKSRIMNYELRITNVKFLGNIKNDKLPLYYSAVDALIVPSVHEEGFGRVILESLACGTPVIAANRGGISEALTQEVGYLIDISPEKIAETIMYCYRHPKELAEKSKKAVIYAKKHFSEMNIHVILNTYRSK